MASLFGTDGVRGKANVCLTPELALELARSIAEATVPSGGRVIIGRDPRVSGPMLEASLAAGFASAGVDVGLAGVIPTPAISFLIKDERADLGAVISASHNPPEDNGIKFFDRRGMKLTVEEEQDVERIMARGARSMGSRIGSISPVHAGATRYAAFLSGTIDADEIDLAGAKLVIDCAYGATAGIAPHVFRHLGADVVELHCQPDGARINQGCGSTDLRAVREAVRGTGAQLGVAFDGDGDRVLLVAPDGGTIDGDRMIGIAALHRMREGRLDPATVVVTVLSNLGLETLLAEQGISVIRTSVGDRHVAHAMFDSGARIGGEPSGHVILSDYSPTGDGILTTVKLLEIAQDTRTPLEELAATIPLHAQEQRTVSCAWPHELVVEDEVRRAIEQAERGLCYGGRVLVRASGTQPVVRILVEAADADTVRVVIGKLEAAIRARAAASIRRS